jgi:hypothetical protein
MPNDNLAFVPFTPARPRSTSTEHDGSRMRLTTRLNELAAKLKRVMQAGSDRLIAHDLREIAAKCDQLARDFEDPDNPEIRRR